MSTGAEQSVQVAVRIRPLVASELTRGCESIAKKTPQQPQVVVSSGVKNADMYTFNYVFAPEDTQEMLYENAAKNLVEKLFKGKRRCAVFRFLLVFLLFLCFNILECFFVSSK